MNFQKLTKGYMFAVLIAGLACVGVACFNLQISRVDLSFLALFVLTISVAPRLTIQIPRFKSHIAVSDTFIFLAILIYGGELAVLLAAVEAFFASWRFCKKLLTVFFNAGAMALSTSLVVLVLMTFGLYGEDVRHGHNGKVTDFLITLAVIALSHFVINTGLAAMHDSLKNALALPDTWKSKYLWAFITYLVGAGCAGALVRLADTVGFGIIIAAFPVAYLVFLTYKMYLSNVEMSMQQAEKAKEYARALEQRSAALRDSEQRFRSAFTYAPIGIALVSPTGQWLKVNRALTEILGYTAEEFLASDFQSMIFPEDIGQTLIRLNQLIAGKAANVQMEQRYVHKRGHTVWVSWSGSIANESRAENSILIFQLHDITDKKLVEDKLHHEANHDALTGLPNRAYFMRRLAEALQKFRQNPKYHVSVLFIDLDRFKYVNDSLGHLVGDRLLVGISERLGECMRPPDIVARLGGDEFVILVEGRYYNEKVTEIAERIQNKFNLPFQVGTHEIYSSASIGILHATDRHMTSEDMMRDADTAMYHAKREGKGRHQVFDERMHRVAKETLQLETELRRAIERHEFSVAFQPIFSLVSGRIQGAEALARWNHETLGQISPEKFIQMAEEIGLVEELGYQIMRDACEQTVALLDTLQTHPQFRIGINLSCRQFSQPDLVGRIQRVLHETGLPSDRLRLEITESVFLENQERTVEMLHQLRSLGIEIDIDDFGTGYSNLSYLVRLPVSALKIDRSFVSAMGEGGANTEIVQTIISMARNLGLSVVAEGIETPAQLAALKRLNCERAQGFLLARPMPMRELADFMAENECLVLPGEVMELLDTAVQ
jgi:diguanylate cyclase (GGDEF)-like protein/PAS domain S-box-containing protein